MANIHTTMNFGTYVNKTHQRNVKNENYDVIWTAQDSSNAMNETASPPSQHYILARCL